MKTRIKITREAKDYSDLCYLGALIFNHQNPTTIQLAKHGRPQLKFASEESVETILPDRINIPIPNEINDYFRRFPDMKEITRSICIRVSEYFDKNTELSLELYRDPEIEDEYLTLYVRQVEYDEEISDKINSISVEYADKLTKKSGWIIVTTDFKHPQKKTCLTGQNISE
ncbi:MAG: hypothetical protein AB1546_10375 [bacterium]